MGPESIKNSFTTIKQDVFNQAALRLIHKSKEPHYFKTLQNTIEYNLPPEFIGTIAEKVREGHKIMLYSNHTSHAEGLPYMGIADMLISQTDVKGFYMLVAASIATNNQNQVVEKMYSEFYDEYYERGIEFLEITRSRDVEQYGMKKENVKPIRQLVRGMRNGKGMIIFPEASVQGGRKDHAGERYGIQQVEPDVQELLTFLCGMYNIIFVPIALDGGYNLYDPHIKRPPVSTMADLYLSTRLGRVPKKRLRATMGAPFTLDDLEGVTDETGRIDGKVLTEYMMRHVATMLPEELRGIYRFTL